MDVIVCGKGVWICVVTGSHTSWEATSVALRRKQQYKSVSAQLATRR